VELLKDEWLRGVDTDENQENNSGYDEPAVVEVVNSDWETSTVATTLGSHYGDHDEFSEAWSMVSSASNDAAKRVDDSLPNGSSGGGTGEEKIETLAPVAHGTSATGGMNSGRLDIPTRSGAMTPVSDTVSEVGSEVELMLSAVREREETSRQASMQSSPNPAQATSYPWNANTSSNTNAGEGSINGGGGQHGFQILGEANHSLPSLSSVLASASASASVSLGAAEIAEIEEQGGFARQMGLDCYDHLGPGDREDRTAVLSPVLSMRMMEDSSTGGDIHGAAKSTNAAVDVVMDENDIPMFSMMTGQNSGGSSAADSLQDAPLFP
jgi:hypothetical protein